MTTSDLYEYELHRTHTSPAPDRDARNRAALDTERRSTRRHRVADRLRSVADRLDA
jgi:hypothetical protein